MALPIFQRNVVDAQGNILPGAQVTVRDEVTGNLVTLFSDREGNTALSNPFFADAQGLAVFYSNPGEYRIDAIGAGGTVTWRYVQIIDTQDITTIGDNFTDIETVADNIADVNTAAGNIQAIIDAPSEAQAAANSAAAAATSESNAATSASNASASESNAATSASNASTSENNAANSASAAANSATAALASENAAETAETNAANSASEALASENAAGASETNAAGSAAASANSATASANSASAAATSESNADNSASAANTSATNASNSASAASTSATNSANSATASANSASAAATSASNASDSETAAANSATASANSATASANSATSAANTLNAFQDIYHGALATAPTTNVDTGDLYFDTTLNEMRVYDGSVWKSAGSSVNGTTIRQSFTATASQTTFVITGGYDANFADVYLNGVKLVNGVDVDVTSGTQVVLTTGASAGDSVDVIAYGAFEVANTYTQAEVDGFLDDLRAISSYTTSAVDVTVATPTGRNISVLDYTGATGTITLPASASMTVGGRVMIKKRNATMGSVNINKDGTDAVQWGAAQLRLYSDGDYWLVMWDGSRWCLLDGYETGSNANGEWVKSADLTIYMINNVTSGGTGGTLVVPLPQTYASPRESSMTWAAITVTTVGLSEVVARLGAGEGEDNPDNKVNLFFTPTAITEYNVSVKSKWEGV